MLDQARLGVCYYPEQWPAARHASDFRRMRDTGFDFVRLGEGAWNYWEPAEGHYQFALFDRAIQLAADNGMKVLLGTPTYCCPAWVSNNYPDVLRWDFQRMPMAHGSRRNLNYTSPKYLDLSDRLCSALAEHYKDNPHVVGWQLDNEFNCHMETSYAPSDTIAFRRWLRDKYKTLKELNRAWGTDFWSQTYNDWDQLDLPAPTPAPMNPTALLDESRFISDCVVRFAARQAKILRRFNRSWQITHNGLFRNVNGPHLMRELDFFSHDQYPLFHPDWPNRANSLAQARSLSFPFGILEQQAGPGGQMNYLLPSPRPGEIRLWAWQSVAHGSSFICFFRWRTLPYGAEQHWHGLLDQDNRDNRRLTEASHFGKELRRLPDDFHSAPPVKVVGVLRDYDNEINERRINTYTKHAAGEHERWIGELGRLHIPADYIWAESAPKQNPFRGYQVLIAAHQKVLSEDLSEKLHAFVKAGGTLVLGAQSGLQNLDAHIVEQTPPGLLAKLAGVEVEDFTTLTADQNRRARLSSGATLELVAFVERLRLTTAESIGRWMAEDRLLGDAPAITLNSFGKGKVIYIGGYCPKTAIASLIKETLALEPIISASPEVEMLLRRSRKQTYLVLLNHTGSPQRVGFTGSGRELISKTPAKSEWMLEGFGVAVIALSGKSR